MDLALRSSRSIPSFATVPVGNRFVSPHLEDCGASLICSYAKSGPKPCGSAARSLLARIPTRGPAGVSGLHVRERLLELSRGRGNRVEMRMAE